VANANGKNGKMNGPTMIPTPAPTKPAKTPPIGLVHPIGQVHYRCLER